MSKSSSVDKSLLLLCLSLIFLFVGALSGWAPMFRILKSRGIFEQYCKDPEIIPSSATAAKEPDCTVQMQLLEQIVVVALGFFSLVGPVAGMVLDRVGFSAALTTGIAFQIASYALVINSNSYLVFAGFVLMGIGGGFLCVALNVFVVKIFPESGKIVSALASALLDSGGIVFIVFYYLFKSSISFTSIFAGYGLLELVMLAIVLVLYRSYASSPSRESVLAVTVADEEQVPLKPKAKASFREVMFTAKGAFVILFPFFEYCRVSWIIATVAGQLMMLGDSGTNSIIGAILVGAGIVYVPIVLYSSERLDDYWSAIVLDVLGICSLGLLLIDQTFSILLACALIGLARTWIFAFLLQFVNSSFPREFRGRAYGLAVFACAFSSMFQVLLIYLTHSVFGTKYQYGSYILLSLSVFTLPLIHQIKSSATSYPELPEEASEDAAVSGSTTTEDVAVVAN